jgi:hypothetical protein
MMKLGLPKGRVTSFSKEARRKVEDIPPITTEHYLYLSGTPFRAIASGEFIEEQIYNWTYSDEQRAKRDWQGPNNPYAALPRVVLLTYQFPGRDPGNRHAGGVQRV